jgi:hypothetical protein
MNGMPSYSMWWLIILWDWYMHNGDMSFLLKQKDYAVALMYQLCNSVNADGTDTIPSYFLDWPTNGTPDAPIGARSLLVIALEKAVNLAKIYDEEDLSLLCAEKAVVMKNKNTDDASFKAVKAFQVLAGIKDAKEMNPVLLEGGAKGLSTFLSFYILKAMAMGGSMADTLSVMKEYYGAMLDKGATTFWEEYKPDLTGSVHYAMYNQPYGKSLCHAWGASPVYLLGRFFLGVTLTSDGYRTYTVSPSCGGLNELEGTIPTPHGNIHISITPDHVSVEAPFDGGTLRWNGQAYPIPAGATVYVPR